MATKQDSAETAPLVVVFAGPNGSGKTSLIDELRITGLATMRGIVPLPAYFINPDQVAKDLKGDFADQNARDEAAQRAAMQARAQATASRLPFAFETVMSHPSRISEMLLLKEQGYHLFLTFITTNDPERNVERVKFRYETGSTTGHYVKPERSANVITVPWHCCRALPNSPMRSMSMTTVSMARVRHSVGNCRSHSKSVCCPIHRK